MWSGLALAFLLRAWKKIFADGRRFNKFTETAWALAFGCYVKLVPTSSSFAIGLIIVTLQSHNS
jgi:hypothetical protein